jgi:alkylated DNA repair dioxygenase AlkB
MSKCSKLLENFDFDNFSHRIDTLSMFDSRLQHLILKENSLTGLDVEIKKLTELISSLSPSLHTQNLSPDTGTPNISETTQSYDTLTQSINKLQADLDLLTSSPIDTTPSPATDSTNSLLTDISNKLDKLCTDENTLSEGLGQIKQSIQSLQSAACQTQHPTPHTPQNLPPPPPPTLSEDIPPIPHKQVPVSDKKLEFIGQSEAEAIIIYLGQCNFNSESGHSVVSFGVPYHYTGSKSSENVPPMPDLLVPLVEKINTLQKQIHEEKYKSDSYNPSNPPCINSCLINKYEGSESFLPRHSDQEVTIDPESSIFTISLGTSCDVKFTERNTNSETVVNCPDRSMYCMTRRSQEVFKHEIEKGSIERGVRYSLTFRCLSWTNKNASCLIGDSNTGSLRFGSNRRGTFGELMPGRKFWAGRIHEIDPVSCMGYSNVVLLCGINDLKRADVGSDNDVADYFVKFKQKVKQIQLLSPSTRAVFVCPLLPTKDILLNRKVNTFNRLVYENLVPTCKDVVYVDGFIGFARDHVLSSELSRQFDKNGRQDILHLNHLGARVLAGLIKRSVFLRLNGGVDRRRHTGKLDGRLYTAVAMMPPAPRRSWNG